jgi:hypothetical protein
MENSVEVVENQLKVAQFIDSHKDQIYAKMEANYQRVRDEQQAHLMFVALSLPLVSGVIHVGSTLQDFKRASEWVKQKLRVADPVAILSTLTLVYIVEKGLREFADSGDLARKEQWEGMNEWMQSLLHAK